MTLTWINILILFGALQGLIFGIVLLLNKQHPGAKFLSIVMFTLAYNSLETFNWGSGLNNIYFEIFSFTFIFASGPALYLYLKSMLHPEISLTKRVIFTHFGIVFFQLGLRIGIVVYHVLWINKIFETNVTPVVLDDWYRMYSEPLSVIVFTCYVLVSAGMFRNFKATRQIQFVSRETQHTIYKWIHALLLGSCVLSGVWFLTILSPHFFKIPFGDHYYPIEILLVSFTYALSIVGYHKAKTVRTTASKIPPLQLTDIEKLIDKLRNAMEHDKLYLDPSLNLSKLAAHTGIQAKAISAVLNQHKKISFNDFINDYRIREVKSKIVDPANKHLTISGIALELGFNSQATFQRAFKNSTGMSPREYINSQLQV